MKFASLRAKLRAGLADFLLKRIRLRGRSPAEYFAGPDKIYVASADQFSGLQDITEAKQLRQCEHFYSVIGGMGGLNILARMDRLESITFFDINPDSATVCRIYLALIRNSRDRDDFVSLLYGRPFSSQRFNLSNQGRYYAMPLDATLQNRTREVLGNDLYLDYQAIYLPYIRDPLKDTYDGITRHATRMPVFHEAPPHAVMTYPFYCRLEMKWRGISCVNSIFMGKGWLASDARFHNVKQLLQCPTRILITPLHLLEPPENSGLYASNVVDRDYPGLRPALNRFSWTIAYSPLSEFQQADYILEEKRLIPISAVYGDGIGNPHKTCCLLLDAHFDLDTEAFLEIIHPHSQHEMNYGFRFYRGQQPVAVEDFLQMGWNVYRPSIIGVHILLGGGTARDAWQQVVEKASRLFHENEAIRALFIFEHHKACLDWPEEDVDYANILEEVEIDRRLLNLDAGWRKYAAPSVTGDSTNVRNLCWILRKSL